MKKGVFYFKDDEGKIKVSNWFLEVEEFLDIYHILYKRYDKEKISWNTFYDELEKKTNTKIEIVVD